MKNERYGVVIHGRWSDSDEPLATVIRSNDGWTWYDLCTTDPDAAREIAEALDKSNHIDNEYNNIEIERLKEIVALGTSLVDKSAEENKLLRDEIARLTQEWDDMNDEIANCRVLEWHYLADKLAAALRKLTAIPADEWHKDAIAALAAYEEAYRER